MADLLSNLQEPVQRLIRPVTSDAEQGLLNTLPGHKDPTLEQDQVYSDFYLAKLSEKVSRDLIDSNERLSKSSSKQAKALNWLTGGIVSVGVVQIILIVIRGLAN